MMISRSITSVGFLSTVGVHTNVFSRVIAKNDAAGILYTLCRLFIQTNLEHEKHETMQGLCNSAEYQQ
eukprot:scaffold11489_cov18-Tisochrysis_lutea.AAC.1